jgi:hypothetical protein
VLAYFLCIVLSGAALRRWKKEDALKRSRYWQLYGLFCGLILCGSCFGVLSWLSWMQRLVNNYQANDSPPPTADRAKYFSEISSFYARSYRWYAAFSIFYPVEFFSLSLAELLVLDRMYQFVALMSNTMSNTSNLPTVTGPRRWVIGRQIVVSLVLAGNFVGLAGNIAAAVYHAKASELFSASSSAAAASFVNVSNEFRDLYQQARVANDRAVSVGAVQSFCEVFVLILIVAAYFAVCFSSVRRMPLMMSLLNAVPSITSSSSLLKMLAKQLHLRIFCTTASVFFAFIIRSSYSTMYPPPNSQTTFRF